MDTVEQFGSGKLTLEEILTPAIELGERGFPVAPVTAYHWQRSEELLRNAPGGHQMLKEGRAPSAGEIMKMPNLAQTFRYLYLGRSNQIRIHICYIF